jgi:hypothetical protein
MIKRVANRSTRPALVGRLTSLPVVLCALVVAGCGGSSNSSVAAARAAYNAHLKSFERLMARKYGVTTTTPVRTPPAVAATPAARSFALAKYVNLLEPDDDTPYSARYLITGCGQQSTRVWLCINYYSRSSDSLITPAMVAKATSKGSSESAWYAVLETDGQVDFRWATSPTVRRHAAATMNIKRAASQNGIPPDGHKAAGITFYYTFFDLDFS